jgi:hypothetical protein
MISDIMMANIDVLSFVIICRILAISSADRGFVIGTYDE